MGKKRGQRFIILKEPIITSNRKAEWYDTKEWFSMIIGMITTLRPLRSREACNQMWYKRPNKDPVNRIV